MERVARRIVTALRWSPHAALIVLASATIAHLVGWDSLAEVEGDAVFFLAAIAVCVRR